jgi:hypothetical protein
MAAMSSRGVFGVDRGIWLHPAFDREAFTQREAWMWLISEAAFRPYGRRVDGKELQLDRGQLCHSVRFMAEAWQWSKSRVDRFLNAIEKQDMIRREHGTRTPVLTICNYDEYQTVSLPKRDEVGTTTGTRAGQERDKLEYTKNTKGSLLCESGPEKAKAAPIAKPTKRDISEPFERFRAAYPKRDGGDPREPARKKFEAMVKSGVDPEAIIAGAQAFANAERKNVGTRFIPHSATWLNKRTWEDYAAVPAETAETDVESWRVPIQNWQRDPTSWSSHAWGPAPGEPGCTVPSAALAGIAAQAVPASRQKGMH